MAVEHRDNRRDGPLTEAAMRAKLENRGYRVTRYLYGPGTWFPDHAHGVDKINGVLSGRFCVILEGDELALEPGDCVAIPRGAVHSAKVVGEQTVVSLDAARG